MDSAILQVLVWHYLVPSLNHHDTAWSRVLSASLNLTWTGVDLFFVLSGFLIGGILIDNRGAPNLFGVFYARRFLRIIPLYVLTIAAFQAFGSPDAIWPYLTFTQNMVWAADGHWGPAWTGVTWSLAVEEQFYLVLPLIIWCTSPRLLPAVLLALCCCAPVARLVCADWAYSAPYAAYLLMPCRMDALFGGVLVAWFVRRPRPAEPGSRHAILLYGAIGVLSAGVVMMLCAQQQDLSAFMFTIGYTWIAAFYASILILVTVRSDVFELRVIHYPFRLLGLGAYAIYLCHQPLLNALWRFGGDGSLTLVLATCGTMVIAWLSWQLIENPCIAFGRRRFHYRLDVAAAVPVL